MLLFCSGPACAAETKSTPTLVFNLGGRSKGKDLPIIWPMIYSSIMVHQKTSMMGIVICELVNRESRCQAIVRELKSAHSALKCFDKLRIEGAKHKVLGLKACKCRCAT